MLMEGNLENRVDVGVSGGTDLGTAAVHHKMAGVVRFVLPFSMHHWHRKVNRDTLFL